MIILMQLISANDTDVTFKICAPISTCEEEINNVFIDEANHIYIAIPMYKLIEYSNNYLNTSGSLSQFRRDEVSDNNAHSNVKNSQSFKYKAVLVRMTTNAAGGKSFVKDIKTVVRLKYLSNFWRSLEMPLINYKVHLDLN